MFHEEQGRTHALEGIDGEPIFIGLPVLAGEPIRPVKLTMREREIAEHVARGMTNSEVAKDLFISIDTVKRHVANIYVKTGVRNRVQLVKSLYHL